MGDAVTWTPFRVYLTALSYTTGMVILLGTFTVQCAGDWSRIRQRPLHPTAPEPRPTNILHSSSDPVKPGFQTLAESAADLCGVDRDLAWSLALRESSGRHWGPDGKVLRSSSSAWGLYQIKKATARDVDPKLDIMQPWGNALAGLCHYRGLLDKAKGDRRLALRWYHRGEYARGPVPQATHDYVDDIMEGSEVND